MARQFFKRGTDVFELGEQGERKLELPEFKSLGLNFDFLKEGQPISLNEGVTGNADQMINEELVKNNQDPFNLENQSTDQLSQILNTIQSQISQGNQNQTSALDILKQSREAAGIPGLTEKLAGVQSLIGQRETGFEQASNVLSEQLAPQPFITGQQAALERRKQTELAGLQRQEQVLESQLGRAETGARFEAGLVADELKELRGRPKELIDLVSKAFGLQADIAGERRAEAQEKRAVEKALRDAKAENRPKFEQVGSTLLRLDPDGTVTPVFRGEGGGGVGGIKFTDTQIAKGATSSHLGIEGFKRLSADTKNYFINRSKEMDENFASIDRRIKNGDTRQEIESAVSADLDAAGLAPNVAEEIKSVISNYLETKNVPTEKKPGIVGKAVGAVRSWWDRLF